ncbi:MAG: hypothetical protein ACOH2B_05390 [Burkholderiaceae bacterium]
MKNRVKKRLFYSRIQFSVLLPERYFWSAEERAWDEMIPVGREFGSKDFYRLEYEGALEEIDNLKNCKFGTPEWDRLSGLAKLVEAYESKHQSDT